MEQVHKFKNLACMMNDRGADKLGCEKFMNARMAGVIKAPVNEKRLSQKCASFCTILIPTLMCGRRERIRAVQVNNRIAMIGLRSYSEK